MHTHHEIFSISNSDEFVVRALEIFRHQYSRNSVYHQFCQLLGMNPSNVDSLEEIPFLPIEFFKTKSVVSSEVKPEIIFTSSGTTGSETSKHNVSDLDLYRRSFERAFNFFYGDVEQYVILALLPSYLERQGSSLIYMVQALIQKSRNEHSGFFLNDLERLSEKIKILQERGQKILLIGVSFALLDLAEKYPVPISNGIVMETGGMKGRRKEMVRSELHQKIQNGLGVEKVHSEYGMTELLSQAYSDGGGIFRAPPWMKLLIRDPEDPLSLLSTGKTGGVNVIDFANINSCSFIATQDLGKKREDGTTEILGRFDNSDIRGCNLLVL